MRIPVAARFLLLAMAFLTACAFPMPAPPTPEITAFVPTPLLSTTVPVNITATLGATETATPTPQPTLTLLPTYTRTGTPSATFTPRPSSTSTPRPPTPTLTDAEKITIFSVQMFNKSEGFGFAPGDIYSNKWVRTTDGGQSWSDIPLPTGDHDFSERYAFDPQHLWVAPYLSIQLHDNMEYGHIHFSQDGGASWQLSEPFPLTVMGSGVPDFGVTNMFFLDAQHGWALANVDAFMNRWVTMVLRTQDGGATWEQVANSLEDTMSCWTFSLAFVDAQHGYLASHCAQMGIEHRWIVFTTADGGESWERETLPPPLNAPEAVFSSNAQCGSEAVRQQAGVVTVEFVCQVENPNRNRDEYIITYVRNNGLWMGYELRQVTFFDAQRGLALGPLEEGADRYFYHTQDGGASWTRGAKVTWANAQLSYVDSRHGWAVVWRWNEVAERTEFALVYTSQRDGPWALITPRKK